MRQNFSLTRKKRLVEVAVLEVGVCGKRPPRTGSRWPAPAPPE
jgi:hypothetical protein